MQGRGRKSLEKMLSQVGSKLGALGTAIYARVLISGVMDPSETQTKAKHPVLRVQQADSISPTASALSQTARGWPMHPGQEPLITLTNSLPQPAGTCPLPGRRQRLMVGGTVVASHSWKW